MVVEKTDAAARRRYWTEQMETAFAYMEKARRIPVRECGERALPLKDAVAASGLDVRFSTTKVAGQFDRPFFLREGLVSPLLAAARALNERGWALKVEDAYRSRAIQTALGRASFTFDVILSRVVWESEGSVPSPELMLRRLAALVATRPCVGTHMSASALDVSVVRRDDGTDVDRGGPYLELSELTPMGSPFISAAAARNRREITDLMDRFGFVAYPFEFWHYSQGDVYQVLAGKAAVARYGAVDLDPVDGRTRPLDAPDAPLHSPEDIQRYIAAALQRRTE